jgi:hypothetical protein
VSILANLPESGAYGPAPGDALHPFDPGSA